MYNYVGILFILVNTMQENNVREASELDKNRSSTVTRFRLYMDEALTFVIPVMCQSCRIIGVSGISDHGQ